jgi:hypothetical protein
MNEEIRIDARVKKMYASQKKWGTDLKDLSEEISQFIHLRLNDIIDFDKSTWSIAAIANLLPTVRDTVEHWVNIQLLNDESLEVWADDCDLEIRVGKLR